jgi:hypothetical protein
VGGVLGSSRDRPTPFLIGLFLFGAVHTSDLHTAVGYGLFELGIPLLLISGLLALPKKRDAPHVSPGGRYLLQILLVNLRDTSSILASLHPLNAFALLLIAMTVVKRDRALLRQPETKTPGPCPSANVS